MAFSVKVLADSVAPCGKRLTTWECTYPRIIHSEIMTHRALSRNSASSRAIPTEKLIQRVLDDPFVPIYIGKNQKGMQAGGELEEEARRAALEAWLLTRDSAVAGARRLAALGTHKQLANRLIEPWMWITVIISATETDNFFGLRDHEAAEPHFQMLAREMRRTRNESTPRVLSAGEWHLPMVSVEDRAAVWTACTGKEVPKDEAEAARAFSDHLSSRAVDSTLDIVQENLIKVSVGRLARVSYLTHDGRRDVKEDVRLHDDLMAKQPLHASPAEHVAQALDWPAWAKSHPDLVEIGVDRLQNEVVLWKRDNFDYVTPPAWMMRAETVLAQLRSGNFIGFRQYRKTFKDENIGGLKP